MCSLFKWRLSREIITIRDQKELVTRGGLLGASCYIRVPRLLWVGPLWEQWNIHRPQKNGSKAHVYALKLHGACRAWGLFQVILRPEAWAKAGVGSLMRDSKD